MGIDVIFAYVFGIMVLFLVAKLLLLPIKIVWKLAVNAVVGGITLIIVNFIGAAVFNIFGYLYLMNRQKHSFVEKIMIKRKEV